MSLVAVVGATGGAGATTVVAHLASAVTQQDKPVLCLDFCPTNILRLHFGTALAERAGFARALLDGTPWQDAAFTSTSGVAFLPFGTLDGDADLDRISAWLQQRPHWLPEALASTTLAPQTMVICDCPRLPAALRNQVLAAADLTLVVCAPTPLALAAASHMANQLRERAGQASAVLLNGFEAGRALDRDMQLLLRRQHANLAAPVSIHRDESLREALAHKLTVFDYAPASQAAQEFAALATWVIARTVSTTSAAVSA